MFETCSLDSSLEILRFKPVKIMILDSNICLFIRLFIYYHGQEFYVAGKKRSYSNE